MALRLGLDARKWTDFGIGTYVEHLAIGLDAHEGVDLVLFVRLKHAELAREACPFAKIVHLEAESYGFSEQLRLPPTAMREGLDLLHLPHWVIPLAYPRAMITTIHDTIQLFYPPPQNLAMPYLRFMMRRALRRSRRVLTVSRRSRSDLVAYFGANAKRIDVVPNGVDADLADAPSDELTTAIEKRHRLRGRSLLVVGNDKPHKNANMALRAFHLAVRGGLDDVQLVFVGGFEPGHPIERRAKSMGIGDRVRCIGRVDRQELIALYHRCDCLIHLALYEGFGLPVLEAMKAGTPVIASNLGAIRELAEGSAELVNPLDVDEVALSIVKVLSDPETAERLRNTGKRRAESLSWSACVDDTIASYQRAIEAA